MLGNEKEGRSLRRYSKMGQDREWRHEMRLGVIRQRVVDLNVARDFVTDLRSKGQHLTVTWDRMRESWCKSKKSCLEDTAIL